MNQQAQESFRVLENVIFLKKTQLFSGVRTGDLKAVALIAHEYSFATGEMVVKENDVGDSMYVIKTGSVVITKTIANGGSITLATLSTGDCFGDMAVIDTELRSATVSAAEPCELLKIDRDNLMDVIVDFPSISIELLKTFVKRLRSANASIRDLSHKEKHATEA